MKSLLTDMNLNRISTKNNVDRTELYFILLFAFGSIWELSVGEPTNIIMGLIFAMCAVFSYLGWW